MSVYLNGKKALDSPYIIGNTQLEKTGVATAGTTVYDSYKLNMRSSIWDGAAEQVKNMSVSAGGDTSLIPLHNVEFKQDDTAFFQTLTVGANQAAFSLSPMPGATTNDTGMTLGTFNKITGSNTKVFVVTSGVAQYEPYSLGQDGQMNNQYDKDEEWSVEKGSETETVNITASASISAGFSNLTGTNRIIGVCYRVDSALAAGETWDANWDNGATVQNIATAEAVDQNTKASKYFDYNAAKGTDENMDIIITKNGGGSFTAQGTITFIVYYEKLNSLSNV